MFSCARVFRYALILALLVVAFPATSGIAQPTGARRTVAIGDIHGNIEGLTRILRHAGITDASGRWVAGTTTVVQTGDMTDRGADVRAVLDLLMDLERQASAAGGRLVVLLGNHEVMNMVADFHDVTPEIYAAFADARSEERRRKAYETYVRFCAARAALFEGSPPKPFQPVSRDQWMEAHPPGAIEYRDAFGPRGRYGRWLRTKSAVLQLGDTVFMHAGINPARAPERLDDINKQVSNEIRKVDDYRRRMIDRKLILPWSGLSDVLVAAQIEIEIATALGGNAAAAGREPIETITGTTLPGLKELLQIDRWSLFDAEGPMWFRGFATWLPEEGAVQIKTLLQRYNVAHFVVGHTVVEDRRIRSQFSGAVFLIDTGMVFAGGTASALEIHDGRFVAIYPDERTVLLETGGRAVPVPR